MDDYISREAAKKAGCERCDYAGTRECVSCVNPAEAIPAADVVEVVRCRDCKHWFDNGTDYCSCDCDALIRHKDFFCAYGVRMDGDGE